MCGIAGFHSNLNINSVNVLKKMLNTIYHRGPDEEGIYSKNGTALGIRRLSVIDVNTGKQPIENEDKSIVIVFNGEIYNFRELSVVLKSKGHSFSTQSDTESIIHSYEEYGVECLGKLNGMFSFCLYDKKKQILFCARDRVGKKPFHFYADKKSFVFSSEIKGILEFPYLKKIDMTSLVKYLLFGFIPAPNTIFENIHKLLPGHYLIYNLRLNSYEIQKYWEFDFSDKVSEEKIIVSNIEHLLTNAVQKRLVSDVPLGALLSGGLDSSLVVTMMAKFMKSNSIKTFSIGFKEKAFDESEYARKVATLYGTDHHLKIVTMQDCIEVINEIMSGIDEPLADPSIVPTYLLSKFARQYVTVALSGDGGDEMFGGYPKYYIHKAMHIYEKVPKFFRRSIIDKAINLIPTNPNNRLLNFKVKKFLQCSDYSPEYRNQLWVGAFTFEEIYLLLNLKFEAKDCFAEIDFWANSFNGYDLLDKIMFLDTKLSLQDLYLVKVDRASMLNSLEVRSPFLDNEIIAFSSKIPSRLKVKRLETKYILKQLALKYLPKELVYRKKRGFGLPIARWIKENLWINIVEMLNDSKIDFINKNYVLKLIDNHKKGISDNSGKIWNIYIFLLWYNRYGI